MVFSADTEGFISATLHCKCNTHTIRQIWIYNLDEQLQLS